MVMEIPLTQGKVALVDDDMFEAIGHLRWYARRDLKLWYAARSMRRKDGQVRMVHLHHFITGEPLHGKHTDHIDGDGLNNVRSNLRIVDQRTNCLNRIDRRNGLTSSHLPGVTWDKSKRKWKAQITVDGIHKNLGRFDHEEDASDAYQRVLAGIK